MGTENDIVQIDFHTTSRLGIDGLTVVRSNDGTALSAIYEPSTTPYCPRCDCPGKAGGFTDAEFYDILNDNSFDESPEVVRIKLKRRRYQCPKCRQEIKTPLPFLRSGERISVKMKEWISHAALTKSYDEVSGMLDGCVSSPHVRKIFRAWIEERDKDFQNNIATPEILGVHHLTVGDTEYLAVSNIEEQCFIDLFPYSDFVGLSQLLVHLAGRAAVGEVDSDFDWHCIMPSFAVYRQSRLAISCESLLKSFTRLLLQTFESEYKGAEKATIRRVISAPLTDEFVTRDERNTATKRLSSYSVLNDLYTSQITLIIRCEAGGWNQVELAKWKKTLPTCSATEAFIELMDMCDTAFGNAILPTSHCAQFHEIGESISDLIASFPKCSFEVLRARIRYSTQPKVIRRKTGTFSYVGGVRKYEQRTLYAGIPLD